jgi:hypothetical protein
MIEAHRSRLRLSGVAFPFVLVGVMPALAAVGVTALITTKAMDLCRKGQNSLRAQAEKPAMVASK